MLVELGLDRFWSHGPVGRSHIARRGARSDGPQARGYNAGDPSPIAKNRQRRKIEKSERSRLSTMLRMMQVTIGK